MRNSTRALIAAAAVASVGLGGFGIAAATSGDGSNEPTAEVVEDDGPGEADSPITGTALDRGVAAALEHTGGGEVTETEMGDDGAAYGVEIRLDDGSQVEVNLDADFNVIGSEPDDD